LAGSCRVHVTCMGTGLSEILNHNECSPPLLGAYMYTRLQTWWCYSWLNSLSQILLHSHCSSTTHISTVFLLGFLVVPV
jgi:hypothetical protein